MPEKRGGREERGKGSLDRRKPSPPAISVPAQAYLSNHRVKGPVQNLLINPPIDPNVLIAPRRRRWSPCRRTSAKDPITGSQKERWEKKKKNQ